MQSAKTKLKKIVQTYIELNPEEMHVFKEYMEKRRDAMTDDKFGRTQESHNVRALVEIPVALHDMIIKGLDEDETEWFKSGGAAKNEGNRWFATQFPVFRLPESV